MSRSPLSGWCCSRPRGISSGKEDIDDCLSQLACCAQFDLCICEVGAAEDQERRAVVRKKGPGGGDAGEEEDEQDRSRWRREHQREMAARAARLQARKE